MCFQCAYENMCGNIRRADCETIKKVDFINLIERERNLIQGNANRNVNINIEMQIVRA